LFADVSCGEAPAALQKWVLILSLYPVKK